MTRHRVTACKLTTFRAIPAYNPRMFKTVAAPSLAILLMLAGCAPAVTVSPSVLPAVTAAVAAGANAGAAVSPSSTATQAATASTVLGYASWYGPGFAGRHTANGEIFNPAELTAAHRTLPFNTRVRVTLVSSGQSVIVRINDRGPFKDNRVIDLSRAAADAIGLTASGVGQVQLEILSGSGVVSSGASAELTPYEVVARGRLLGELLIVSSAVDTESEPVMVRVVGNELPPEAGADLLMSEQLFEQLGADILVNSD